MTPEAVVFLAHFQCRAAPGECEYHGACVLNCQPGDPPPPVPPWDSIESVLGPEENQ